MSRITQATVVNRMEEDICIAVIRGQIQLFPLLFGFDTAKIPVHPTKTNLLGGEGVKTRVVTLCRFLHSRSHTTFLLDPILNLCQQFLYKSLF